MSKKQPTEADIRTKFITPALVGPGGKWDVMTQLREEFYFTKGRVIVRGKTIKRGEAKKADYLLFYKPGIPIAVIEAKDNNQAVGAGMQQALEYAEILDIPFAYSSNGDAFLEHDRTATGDSVEREIPLEQFPSPENLWARYRTAKGFSAIQEMVTTQDTGRGRANAFFRAIPAGERYLLKLHSNIDNAAERVLSQDEYSDAYGNEMDINMTFPLPKLLKRLFISYSFFFLGCSLTADRTLQTFMRVAGEEGPDSLPHHYAILPCPIDIEGKRIIDQHLADAHITPLWYPEGEHEHVEQILELLLD